MRKLEINELKEFMELNGENYIFSHEELNEIKIVETKYKIRGANAKLVGHFVKYKLTNWIERIDGIKALKNTITRERYILLMGDEEGEKYWEQISNGKKNGQTLESYKKKYGLEDGVKRWNTISKNRGKSTFNKQYWIEKGLTEQEAANKISVISKKASIIGNKTQSEMRENDYESWAKKMPTTIHYWLEKGYSKEEAKDMVSKRQTRFSKDICIKKYGFDEGMRIWKARQEKWEKAIYFEDDKGNMKSKMHNRQAGKASKESLKVLNSVIKLLDEKNIKYRIGIDGNSEFGIKYENRSFFYDLVIPSLNLVFEYNGEAFHPNPKWKEDNPEKWKNWRQTYKNDIDAEIKYKFDCLKNKAITESRGFEVVELWSSDSVRDNIKIALCRVSQSMKEWS